MADHLLKVGKTFFFYKFHVEQRISVRKTKKSWNGNSVQHVSPA